MAVFNVINHTELTGTATSWDVTSIPSSYDHLYIIASIRGDTANHYNGHNIRFNGVAGSGYGSVQMWGYDTGGFTDGEITGQDMINQGYHNGASSAANSFGGVEIWIADYASTSKYKQMHSSWNPMGTSTTGYQWVSGQNAALWESTAAINQITLFPDADNFVQYSTFTLYGINGA